MEKHIYFDYIEFEKTLLTGLFDAFSALKHYHKHENIYLFGLRIFADHGIPRPFVYTEELLDREAKFWLKNYRGMSLQNVKWRYRYSVTLAYNDEYEKLSRYLNSVNSGLRDWIKQLDTATWEERKRGHPDQENVWRLYAKHERHYEALCLRTLKALDQAGVFGSPSDRERIFLLFNTNRVIDEEIILRNLNPEICYQRYQTAQKKAASFSNGTHYQYSKSRY